MLLDWLKEAKLDRVGCFKYEPVKGAAANDAGRPGAGGGQGGTLAPLHEARSRRCQRKRMQAKVGRRLPVIVDEAGPTVAKGRSNGRCAGDRRFRLRFLPPPVAGRRHRDGQDRARGCLRPARRGGVREEMQPQPPLPAWRRARDSPLPACGERVRPSAERAERSEAGVRGRCKTRRLPSLRRLLRHRPLTLACCAGLPPSAALSPQAGRGEGRLCETPIAAACRRSPSCKSSCPGSARRQARALPLHSTALPSCFTIGHLNGLSLPDLMSAWVCSARAFTSSGMFVKGAITTMPAASRPRCRRTSTCRRGRPSCARCNSRSSCR